MLVTICKVQRLQQFNGSTISYAQEVTVLSSYLTGINFREEIHTFSKSCVKMNTKTSLRKWHVIFIEHKIDTDVASCKTIRI